MAFLIGGHPRSGTTILNRLCIEHPDITMTVEFGNYLGCGQNYREYMRELDRRWASMRREINPGWTFFPMCYRRNHRLVRLQFEWLRQRYLFQLRRRRHDLIDAPTIERIMRSILPAARVVGDKLPNYVYALDTLAPQPGLKIAIIYRDARDVVQSTLKLARTRWVKHLPYFEHDVSSATAIARNWVDAIDIMERHRTLIHPIRYEELVSQPRRVLDALADYLRVDPAGFNDGMITPSSIGKYEEGLTDKERNEVWEIAARAMQKLDYA